MKYRGHKRGRLESRIFWSIAIWRREKLGSHLENAEADEYLDNDQIPWERRGNETKRANEANMRRSPSNRANDISRRFAA